LLLLLSNTTVAIYPDEGNWTVTLSGGDRTGVPVIVYNGRRGRICSSKFDDDKSLSSAICQRLDGKQRFNRGRHEINDSSLRYVLYIFTVYIQ